MEDEFQSHHYLQGFSSIVVNSMRHGDPRTLRNPDPAAVQSRRERPPRLQKHATLAVDSDTQPGGVTF